MKYLSIPTCGLLAQPYKTILENLVQFMPSVLVKGQKQTITCEAILEYKHLTNRIK